VMVSCSGTPGAVVVDDPKLLRMSLRTMPLSDRTLETLPLTEFDPSDGKGPLVSTGSTTQLALAEELELELLELLELELELLELVLLEVLSSLLPPQATSVAAAPPEISQPSIWRRSLSRCSRCCLTIASRWFCRPWSWSLGRWRVMLAVLLERYRVWRLKRRTSPPARAGGRRPAKSKLRGGLCSRLPAFAGR
jgi:hypothetical protein